MRNKVIMLVAVMLSSAYGYVTGYHVEPVKAAWSGWTAFQSYVSQTVTCNFDSLSYVELFAGAKGAGGEYTATIYEDGVPLMSSNGDTVPDHGWVEFEDWNTPVAFTKGRTYEVRFARAGGDSIQQDHDSTDMAEQLDCGAGRPRMA